MTVTARLGPVMILGAQNAVTKALPHGSVEAHPDEATRRWPVFVTMVEAQVDSGREPDLLAAWRESTAEGDLPPGLIESSLLRADGDRWRIVTVWESREAVLAMRERGRPAAIVMFERAGARPEVSMWDVEERISAPGFGDLQETLRR